MPAPTSVRISTPSDYTHLITNSITVDLDAIIVIDWRAHPNILSQPKYFGAAPYFTVCFEDGPIPYESNRICMLPDSKWIRTAFFSGSNLTYGLPDDYELIQLYYAKNAACTAADLDIILTWTHSTNIDIFGNCGNAAVYFSQHASQLRDFNNLMYASFSIQPQHYKDVEVSAILANVNALVELRFHVDSLNETEIAEFLGQNVPDGWFKEARRDEDEVGRVVAWVKGGGI